MQQLNQPTRVPYHDKFKEQIINDVDEYMDIMGIEDPVKDLSYLLSEFVYKGDFAEMVNDEPQRAKNLINTVTHTMAFLTGLYQNIRHYNEYKRIERRSNGL